MLRYYRKDSIFLRNIIFDIEIYVLTLNDFDTLSEKSQKLN